MLHLCISWIYFNFVSNAPWALLQFSWTHLSLILARRVLHDQFWARSIFLQTQPDSHRLPTLGFAADGEAGHGGNPQHATAYKGRDKPLMSWSLLINDFPAFSPGWAALSFTRQITSKGASELPGTHLCIGSPHFPALLSCPSLLLSKSHSSITCLHIKYLLEALLYRVPRLREPPVCSTVVLMMVQIHWLLGEKCMEDTVIAKWTRPRPELEDFVMISVEYSKMDKSTNKRNNWNQRFKCSRGSLSAYLICFVSVSVSLRQVHGLLWFTWKEHAQCWGWWREGWGMGVTLTPFPASLGRRCY